MLFLFHYAVTLQKFRIDIVHMGKTEMEFDMVGVDASIANALRRILLAEVGSCFVVCAGVLQSENTGVIADSRGREYAKDIWEQNN